MNTISSEPPPSVQALPVAATGDRIEGTDLQVAIDALRLMANGLDDLITDDLSVAEIQQIGRAQVQLRSDAAALVGRQIDLAVGEAKVAAEQVNAAIHYADAAIRDVGDTKTRLARIAAVVGFVGAVTTGSGAAIVQAANTLKAALVA